MEYRELSLMEEGIHYVQAINNMVTLCHTRSVNAGWYTNIETGEKLKPTLESFGLKIALIHSEISEALEGARKNLMDDHLPERPMAEVELADALIRIFDLAGFYGYDLGGAVIDKLEYNRTREDHKIENRLKDGGKKA